MNSHQRFDSRAADYARGRPGYPEPLIDRVAELQGWAAGRVVADIGSGTGIFTRLILERGAHVVAIEPSAPMRLEAERDLGHWTGFESRAASAAATDLPDASVDAIACAQAFHWFNREETRSEWRRILRPRGTVALIWNFTDGEQAVGAAYLDLLFASGPAAREVVATSLATARENVLFSASAGIRSEYRHEHRMDWDGWLQRTHSVSYLPRVGEPGYAALLQGVTDFFHRFARDGIIALPLVAVLTCGPIEFSPVDQS